MEEEGESLDLVQPPMEGDSSSIQDSPDGDPVLAFALAVTQRQERHRMNRRRYFMAATAVLVTVVLVLVFVGASGPNSKDAAAQVELGARTTLAAGSTTISISGSFSDDGQQFPVTGSGVADLSTNVENMTLNFNASGTAIQESILTNGQLVYMQLLGNGQNEISQLIPGKDWVQLPVNLSASSGAEGTTQNIATQLQLLASQGNSVVALGSSTINGQPVTGYQVTISHQAMVAATKSALKAAGTQATTEQSILDQSSLSPPVIKLWIGSDHLLAREEVTMNVTSVGTTITGDVTFDFSNYGSPVSVSFPASGQIASYSDFLTAANSSSSASS